MSIFLTVILIIIGFGLLIKCADLLVDSSSRIAKKFHIPEIIIGLTIVSIGTSLPELMVSLKSAVSGHSDMSVGNVVGSNVCNLLLILGLASAINPIKFKKETRLIEIPICLVLTIIFGILCNTNNEISRLESILLIILFIMFIAHTIVMGKKGEKFDKEDEEIIEDKEDKKEISIFKNIIFIFLGIISLKIGGDLVVDNSIIIAEFFSISEQIISLTIVAIGTSLPELVTSVVAAIKGNSDISIGNILGSNIFNMALIMGISALINPITYNLVYNFEIGILIVASIVLSLFPVIPPKNKMSRMNGIIYLIMYVVYTIILLKK